MTDLPPLDGSSTSYETMLLSDDCRLPTKIRPENIVYGVQDRTPDLATVKDFLRFYAASSDPRIDMTSDSLGTVAEWFFAGFARVTGTTVEEEDRKEVYHVS
jgi:hypothetical protein